VAVGLKNWIAKEDSIPGFIFRNIGSKVLLTKQLRKSVVKGSDQGYLKVSFFGPFYGSYIVFELDHENYQYSLVCGPDKSYLWILARGPKIKEDIKDILIAKAAALGFDTSKLIFVDHD